MYVQKPDEIADAVLWLCSDRVTDTLRLLVVHGRCSRHSGEGRDQWRGRLQVSDNERREQRLHDRSKRHAIEARPACGSWQERDADSGQARWAYQWSPHDLYDHDGVNEHILVDLPIGGRTRQVLIRPERNGYMYVLDRTTGEVLSADPFVHITSSKGVDLKTGRLIPVKEKEPRLGVVVRDICPASPGAKDWQPAAYSPRTGYVYVPHNNLCMDFEGAEAKTYDMILVSVGRVPNGKKIGAEKAGVAVDERGFIKTDSQMRTNVAHIFAIGDIAGKGIADARAMVEAITRLVSRRRRASATSNSEANQRLDLK